MPDDSGSVDVYLNRLKHARRIRVRIGWLIAAVGAVALVHGLASIPWAAQYLGQRPPETLPGALVAVEILFGTVLALGGFALTRWDRPVTPSGAAVDTEHPRRGDRRTP